MFNTARLPVARLLCLRGECGDVAVRFDGFVSGLREDVIDKRLLGSSDGLTGHEHDRALDDVGAVEDVLLVRLDAVDLHGDEFLAVGVSLVVSAEARVADAPLVASDVGRELSHGSGLRGVAGNLDIAHDRLLEHLVSSAGEVTDVDVDVLFR